MARPPAPRRPGDLVGLDGPPPGGEAEWLAALGQRLEQLLEALNRCAEGDLAAAAPPPGPLGDAVRRLRSRMRRFSKQMQAVAEGDTDVVADPFGPLSIHFNRCTDNLRQVADTLAARNLTLERMANQDPLTGLLNRGHLLTRFQEELSRANRYGEPLSVILIDLDDFKEVNDTWGHQAGDEALRRTARVIRAQGRTSDVFGRYGGEEFLVVATGTPPPQAVRLADRIRSDLAAAEIPLGDTRLRVTASLGVAGKDAADIRQEYELIREADQALYRAKKLGKNRVVLAVPGEDVPVLPGEGGGE